MFTITIDLPKNLEVTSNGATVQFPLGEVNAERLAELVGIAAIAGFTKTIIDAASGAKKLADESEGMDKEKAAETLMQKRIATFLTGEWGSRGNGEGVDPVEAEMISLVRAKVKGALAEAYKKADDAGRNKMCRDYLAKLDDKTLAGLKAYAEQEIERKKGEAERRKAMAESLGL